jgi:hypothetical protein
MSHPYRTPKPVSPLLSVGDGWMPGLRLVEGFRIPDSCAAHRNTPVAIVEETASVMAA